MHRSRLALLVVFAPVAACSTRSGKDPDGSAALSQDSSLAHLDLRQLAAQPQLPDACGAVAAPAAPTGDDERQAGELTRQAYQAELVGDVQQAHTLLHRAAELDGASGAIAYHLGRTSEELGDRTGAVNAYCHYLALAPAAGDTADVHQRLIRLSPSLHVASASGGILSRRLTGTNAPHQGYRAPSPVRSHARVSAADRVRVAQGGIRGGGGSMTGPDDSPPPDAGDHRATADGDVIATAGPSSTQQPVTTSSRRRGGLSHAQGAEIGAAAGAIIAGATGHSVKSAVIGAAAGGILGAVVAGGAPR